VKAKRAIWIIRAVLYPSLALAAVLLLLHRGGESEADGGPTTLYGRTAQGHYFSAGFFEGRVFRVGTFVELRCLDGGTRVSAVSAVYTRGGSFVTDGDRVRVRATIPWDATGEFTHHVRVDARRHGARLSGTVDDVVTRAGRRERVCSGRVSFSAHE
jgi:hypothetical protein